MRILLIGYGKMGKTIEQLALRKGYAISGKIDHESVAGLNNYTSENTDVAIEFTNPEAAFSNIAYCLQNGIPVVSGSTGWLDKFEDAKKICKENNGSFFYASNYSVGVNLFFHFNEYIAAKMQQYPEFGASVKEIHHTQKLDKPSGTAITVAEGILKSYPELKSWSLTEENKAGTLAIESERLENVIGTHIVRYASAVDELELSHVAHSREGFAFGALMAAAWLKDRKGVFGMKDLLNL